MRDYFKKSGLTTIIVATIIAVAFLPKNISQWVILVMLLAWGIKKVFVSGNVNTEIFKEKLLKNNSIKKTEHYENTSDYKCAKMQLGHRISDKLTQVYPNALWTWREEPEVDLFENGGKLRITTIGTANYKEADVVIKENGEIEILLYESKNINNVSVNNVVEENSNTTNVEMWYERRAAEYLTNLITELNTKGTKSLTIDIDGHIKVDEGIEVGILNEFPSKNLWNQLVEILTAEELKAVELDDAICIGW